jgi:hypothetical protein
MQAPVFPTVNGAFIRIIRTNTLSHQRPRLPLPPVTSFPEYVQQRPLCWKQELLVSASPSGEFNQLGRHLLLGTRLLFCTDGGAKNNKGCFGWIIGMDKNCLWVCYGKAPGWFTIHSDQKESANLLSSPSSKPIKTIISSTTSPSRPSRRTHPLVMHIH